MTRVRIGLMLVVCTAALAALHGTPNRAAAEVVAPVYDECSDEIDNDGDGTIDSYGSEPHYENADEGCSDNTPLTERLTSAKKLWMEDARFEASNALGDYYGGRYNHSDDDWSECWRVSRVRVNCRYGFARKLYVYSGVIRLHSYTSGEESRVSTKRHYYWREREPRLRGADEVTILKCTRHTCSLRLTYYR